MPYDRWDKARATTRHGKDLDTSMLLMPLFRFVSATDPDCLATLDAIRAHLVHDGLVRRYIAEEFNRRGYALGNTPQALTHLALISAAFFLDRKT